MAPVITNCAYVERDIFDVRVCWSVLPQCLRFPKSLDVIRISDSLVQIVVAMNQLISGTIAGVSGILVGQPLDTIKVRLQAMHGKYTGPWHCAKEIFRYVRNLYQYYPWQQFACNGKTVIQGTHWVFDCGRCSDCCVHFKPLSAYIM